MKDVSCNDEYLQKAKLLTDEDAERLLSRMGRKAYRKLQKDGVAKDIILGLQLQTEDEQLFEWREKMNSIKHAEEKKKSDKKKKPE